MVVVSFKHEPLPPAGEWIRTLLIDPSSTFENVVCSLVTAPLRDQHTCLSYTWGTADATHIIRVNDMELLVRPNLLDFLRECVRDGAFTDVPLWIDAICINQNDLSEKSIQVARMGKIYAQARSVIVWLGTGNNEVLQALRHMKVCAESAFVDLAVAESGRIEIPRLGVTRSPKQEDSVGVSLRTYWNNFDIVANLTYWKRMWIVQEFLLAGNTTIWYGSLRTDWEVLLEYQSFIQDHTGPEGCDPYLGTHKVTRSSCGWLLRRIALNEDTGSSSLNFSIALTQLWQECAVPRDLVYACRAMDKDLREIDVNYAADPCILLYELFASSAIKVDYIYLGILIIHRLALDIEKTIERTYDRPKDRIWQVDVVNIGCVTGSYSRRDVLAWDINWSAFAYRGRMDRSSLCDDGLGSLRSTDSANSGVLFEGIKSGDLVCHMNLLNVLLVFRHDESSKRTPKSVQELQTGGGHMDAKFAEALISGYRLVGCYGIRAERQGSRKPRMKSEFKNVWVEGSFRESNLFDSLRETRLSVGALQYKLGLTWQALLRIWEQKDTSLLTWEFSWKEAVGTWDEEAAKIRAQQKQEPTCVQ